MSATSPADESNKEKEVRHMNQKKTRWRQSSVRGVLTQCAQADAEQAEPEKTQAHPHR